MLWHGQELKDRATFFLEWFYIKRKLSRGHKAAFKKKTKASIMTILTTFWAFVTRLPMSFVTCNKNHSKEMSNLKNAIFNISPFSSAWVKYMVLLDWDKPEKIWT